MSDFILSLYEFILDYTKDSDLILSLYEFILDCTLRFISYYVFNILLFKKYYKSELSFSVQKDTSFFLKLFVLFKLI